MKTKNKGNIVSVEVDTKTVEKQLTEASQQNYPDYGFKINMDEGQNRGDIVFTVSGFSQFSDRMKRSRQDLYKWIWNRLQEKYGSVVAFPDDYTLNFIHEKNNKYDKNAILVTIKYNDHKSEFDLGYVPRWLNEFYLQIAKKHEMKHTISSISPWYGESEIINIQVRISWGTPDYSVPQLFPVD